MEEAVVDRFEYLVELGTAAFAGKDTATVVVVPSRGGATKPELAAACD